MTNTIVFISILVIVSGLIAYLGDWLGRRMGKRRLTLFHMRPRYTAIVVTTITGMIIAGITIATMLTVSKPLRNAIVNGERIVRENDAYRIRNRDLHDRNTRLAADGIRLTRDVRDKSAQVRAARKDVDAAVKARDEVRLRVQTLEREIGSRQRELADLRRTGKLTKEQLDRISTNLSDRIKELAGAKADLARSNHDLAGKQRELAQKTRELSNKMAELDNAEKSIAKARSTISEVVDVTQKLLMGYVVLQQGQEIGRMVIDSRQSEDRVRSGLIDLLDRASEVATRAQCGSEGSSRAIRLVWVDRQTGRIVENEGECIDAAVQTIVGKSRLEPAEGHREPVEGRSVVACITVVSNTLKDHRAPAELYLFWNNVTFHRGDNIARRMIDGRMSEGRVLLSVMDFLRENVRSAARQAGVIPVANPDPEKAMEPISDEQLDQVMELVDKIRSLNRTVEVRAIAQKDIYAAGPLNLGNIGFAISTLTASK